MGYEWLKGEDSELPFDLPHSVPATKDDLFALYAHLETALDRENYFHPDHKRATKVENLRNIFHKVQLSKQEVRALRGMVSALEGRDRRIGRKK